MGNTYPDGRKDEKNEGDLIYDSKKSYNKSEYKGWTLAQGGKLGGTLVLNLIQFEACESWFQEFFPKRPHGLGIKIPKQIVSLEEKYLKRCLELIQLNALKGAPCAISLNLSSLDMGYMSDNAVFEEAVCMDTKKFAIDNPMAVKTGDLAVSSVDEGIVGSIMESHSMMRILRSPLFQRLGISDHVASLVGTNSFENKFIPSDYHGSPDRLLLSPSRKPCKSGLRNPGHKHDSVKGSPVSESSAGSLLTDKSSAFSLSQGILQCTWEDGIPHFAFSLDDQKDLYVANARKVEATCEKALDYVYSFHLKSSSQKLFDSSSTDSDMLGKMKVSTSYSHCSGNCEVMESEFVLVGVNDNHLREMHTLSKNSRQSRKLSRVVEMFKHGHPMKQRTNSVFGGSSAIPEDFSEEKGLRADWNAHKELRPELSEDDFLPNLELAAVVMKDHLEFQHRQKKEVGGWGLKFIEKAGVKPGVDSSAVLATPSECCLRNVGNCSTSMDIVVPAGPHGGPRARDVGPSSLIQRWRSGGHCDCGGWDIGCPLKVLKSRPIREEGLPYSEAQADCKSFEMFTEGSEQGVPALKMVQIRDGLYFISFQSSFLSPLQCFSIVVATIHSQSPSLRPKRVQN